MIYTSVWSHECFLSVRFLPQTDQSGSSLRHHDQLVRVWKSLFPQTQPGADTSAAAVLKHVIGSTQETTITTPIARL